METGREKKYLTKSYFYINIPSIQSRQINVILVRRGPELCSAFSQTEVNFGLKNLSGAVFQSSRVERIVVFLDFVSRGFDHGAGPAVFVSAVRVCVADVGQVCGGGRLLPGYGQRLHVHPACWSEGVFLPNHEGRGLSGD